MFAFHLAHFYMLKADAAAASNLPFTSAMYLKRAALYISQGRKAA